MSKIILEGFKTKVSDTDQNSILIKNILWYDKINNQLKVGDKRLNYYYDATTGARVFTTKTQNELPSKNVLPVEFTVTEKI